MAITTKKEFKLQVQEHIIDRLSEDQYTELPFQLNEVVEEFKNWYSPYERKVTPNQQQAFISWLNGLPSCLSIEYTNYNITETYKSWFTNIGVPLKKMKDSQMIDLYRIYIYREFLTLCKKNGVQF